MFRSMGFEGSLTGTNIQCTPLNTFRRISKSMCANYCSKTPNCVSYIYCLSKKCELSSEGVFSSDKIILIDAPYCDCHGSYFYKNWKYLWDKSIMAYICFYICFRRTGSWRARYGFVSQHLPMSFYFINMIFNFEDCFFYSYQYYYFLPNYSRCSMK